MLEIRELPIPAVRDGWSLVQVKGAGLNRSELRTRQGHSPNVTFPRVLGIECVGVVAASTDPTLPEGTTVAAVMGEMGREFDGGYAEYALLPNSLLMPVTTTLPNVVPSPFSIWIAPPAAGCAVVAVKSLFLKTELVIVALA